VECCISKYDWYVLYYLLPCTLTQLLSNLTNSQIFTGIHCGKHAKPTCSSNILGWDVGVSLYKPRHSWLEGHPRVATPFFPTPAEWFHPSDPTSFECSHDCESFWREFLATHPPWRAMLLMQGESCAHGHGLVVASVDNSHLVDSSPNTSES